MTPSPAWAREEFQLDVVLLDIGMPVIDGYEMCARIRCGPLDRQPMLVAVTRWGQSHDEQRALDVGFDTTSRSQPVRSHSKSC